MIGVIKRLFKVSQSEAHSMVDKLEDPIKMTEQGIRDLRKDINTSLKSLAEVKALSIRLRADQNEKKQIAANYERKAMLLLEKSQKGDLSSEVADRLATEALTKKENAITSATRAAKDLGNQEKMVAQLEGNVTKLKSQLSKWENELTTLKARAKVASATKSLNKQLANADSDGTIAMLEKMKSKVDEDEALAESYGEIAAVETSVDTEIDNILGGSTSAPASDSLAEMKKKMGII